MRTTHYFLIFSLLLILTLFCCNDPQKPSPGTDQDTVAPVVLTITPADNSESISISTDILIVFNETLDNSVTGTVTLAEIEYIDGTNCSIVFSQTNAADDTIVVNSDTDFDNLTLYTGIQISGFEDVAGNRMAEYLDTVYNFTTADTGSPEVISILVPADNSTDIAITTNIVIVFSETLDDSVPGTVTFGIPAITF